MIECEKCSNKYPLNTISLWREDFNNNITDDYIRIIEEYHHQLYLCSDCLKYSVGDILQIVNEKTQAYYKKNYLISSINKTSRIEYLT